MFGCPRVVPHDQVVHVAGILCLDRDANHILVWSERAERVVPGEEVLVIVTLDAGPAGAEGHVWLSFLGRIGETSRTTLFPSRLSMSVT